MSKHSNADPACSSCEEKLKTAHPDLADWFRRAVKPLHRDAHIAWAYRNEKEQEQAFVDGKSRLKFPLSAHNKSDEHGNPCSLALDLFELDFNGVARWSFGYMRTIGQEAARDSSPIKWGVDGMSDWDHFELKKVTDG